MTFQHPLILAGLAVLVLPALLNLLGRATARRCAWGAMMFLDDSRPAARRGISRQNLLLLSRVGLLAALVLAFARPVRSNGSAAGVQRVIVVDTGPSMGLFDAGINRLDRAKAAALKAIATLKPDDRAALVATGVMVRPTADLQSVAARINELSVSRDPVDLSTCLQSAVSLANDASRREQLCVIGDLSDARWARALATVATRLSERQKLFACNFGDGGANDLVLRDLSVSAAPEARVTAKVDVGNTASTAQEIKLRWAVDMIDRGDSSVAVSAAGKSIAVLPAFGLPVGPHLVTASLAEAIPSTAPELNVTFAIGPLPRVLATGDAAAVVAAAMTAPDLRWTRDLSATDFSSCDLLVLCGGPWPVSDVSGSLSHFVRSGGRLLVLPGDGFDEAKVEASLDKLALLPARGLASTPATLPTLRLTRAGRFLPGSRLLKWAALSRTAHELIPFAGAAPLAISMPAGRGSVMIASTGVGDRWSSLAESPMLGPWLSALVDDLCPPVRLTPALVAGETFVTAVAAPVDAHSAVVQTPDGQSDGIVVRRSADVCEMRYPQTQAIGVYRMSYRSNGRPHQAFFVVRPPSLSTTIRRNTRHPSVIETRTSEQMALALLADRPNSFDGFGPLLLAAIGLFGLGVFLESSGAWGRS